MQRPERFRAYDASLERQFTALEPKKSRKDGMYAQQHPPVQDKSTGSAQPVQDKKTTKATAQPKLPAVQDNKATATATKCVFPQCTNLAPGAQSLNCCFMHRPADSEQQQQQQRLPVPCWGVQPKLPVAQDNKATAATTKCVSWGSLREKLTKEAAPAYKPPVHWVVPPQIASTLRTWIATKLGSAHHHHQCAFPECTNTACYAKPGSQSVGYCVMHRPADSNTVVIPWWKLPSNDLWKSLMRLPNDEYDELLKPWFPFGVTTLDDCATTTFFVELQNALREVLDAEERKDRERQMEERKKQAVLEAEQAKQRMLEEIERKAAQNELTAVSGLAYCASAGCTRRPMVGRACEVHFCRSRDACKGNGVIHEYTGRQDRAMSVRNHCDDCLAVMLCRQCDAPIRNETSSQTRSVFYCGSHQPLKCAAEKCIDWVMVPLSVTVAFCPPHACQYKPEEEGMMPCHRAPGKDGFCAKHHPVDKLGQCLAPVLHGCTHGTEAGNVYACGDHRCAQVDPETKVQCPWPRHFTSRCLDHQYCQEGDGAASRWFPLMCVHSGCVRPQAAKSEACSTHTCRQCKYRCVPNPAINAICDACRSEHPCKICTRLSDPRCDNIDYCFNHQPHTCLIEGCQAVIHARPVLHTHVIDLDDTDDDDYYDMAEKKKVDRGSKKYKVEESGVGLCCPKHACKSTGCQLPLFLGNACFKHTTSVCTWSVEPCGIYDTLRGTHMDHENDYRNLHGHCSDYQGTPVDARVAPWCQDHLCTFVFNQGKETELRCSGKNVSYKLQRCFAHAKTVL